VNVGLGWLGVGVGAVGCAAAYLMAGWRAPSLTDEETARSRRIAWLAAVVTLVLTLIFWAIAMQRRVPYSPGQRLAFGWLIGGLTGTAAILLSFRLSEITSGDSSPRLVRLAAVSNLFYGLFAVSLAYALFANDVWHPMLGFAMGAAMAGILHTYTQYAASKTLPIRTETWAMFAITIAAGVILASEHFDATQLRMWWAMPILLATTITVASYIGIELASMRRMREKVGASHVLAAMIASVIIIGLTAIYAWKLYSQWQLLEVVVIGLGIAAIIGWIAAALARDESEASGMEAGAACVLFVTAFATVAFKLWAGLGIATALLAAWTIAIPSLGDRENGARVRDALTWPLYLGLSIVLFKLFIEAYGRDLHRSDLGIHYTFIGAMLGVVTPFLLAAALARVREACAREWAIAGVALVGLVAAASPLIPTVLWEARSGMGFVFGLTAAMVFMLLPHFCGDKRYSAPLLVIAGQLTAVQFTFLLINLEATRAVRIWVLSIVGALVLVWLGLSALLAVRRRR